MKIFKHHIYEYRKGIRSLVLHTMDSRFYEEVVDKLRGLEIPFIIREVSPRKINVFFGNHLCIEVLERIGDKPLSGFTDEEDFILGTMLGYALPQQCERYIMRKSQAEESDVTQTVEVSMSR